jgi:hypothetical protein
MPIVKMPDGANVSFPDNMPPDQIRSMILQKFPDAGKLASSDQTPEKPGVLSEFGKAITDIPMEVGRTASENVAGIEGALGRGNVEGTSPYNPFQGMGKTAGALSGLAQLPFAIPVGIARSVIGHGMTGLEHLAGQYINPEVAAKDDL